MEMSIVLGLKIVLGAVFVLFIPGFAWSFVFFGKEEIDGIERIALSFGLSIALVPLAIFWLNYVFTVKITVINSFLTVLFLSLLPLVYLFLRGKFGTCEKDCPD
jgi:uncharacterized membrane protein